MSSGGWELVGRNKKDKSNGKINKLTKAEKKKFIENAPKVEDFCKLLFLTSANSLFLFSTVNQTSMINNQYFLNKHII